MMIIPYIYELKNYKGSLLDFKDILLAYCNEICDKYSLENRMDVIGKLKKYKEKEKDPGHHDVQVTLKEFFNVIEEVTNYLDTPQGDIEDIIQKSNISLSEFPTLFTIEEENYIKEAMQQFNT